MLTGSIKALIAKYGRQRLVRTMRGYRYLMKSGEIGRLNALDAPRVLRLVVAGVQQHGS